ncbi:MAG TPA: YbhB/YbcL family Raf kinase inhibitor-like protein [bacterium]|nr:YbhB/YbcL family Raf kinase inhibitor-like protein [bacterium]
MAFQITSRAFKNGEAIPAHYTADGEDVSPPLEWKESPAGTKAFALVCDDPDAASGNFTHWIIFNIPTTVVHLPEAYPALRTQPNGIQQGLNDFGGLGYQGPKPPSGIHRYFFKLYALGAPLDLEGDVKKPVFERAAQRRLLGTAELMGTYERKK